MKKEQLEQLSTSKLQEMLRGQKMLIGVFIPLILLLFYFGWRNYFQDDELGLPILVVAICSVGGLASSWESDRKIRAVLRGRGE